MGPLPGPRRRAFPAIGRVPAMLRVRIEGLPDATLGGEASLGFQRVSVHLGTPSRPGAERIERHGVAVNPDDVDAF